MTKREVRFRVRDRVQSVGAVCGCSVAERETLLLVDFTLGSAWP